MSPELYLLLTKFCPVEVLGQTLEDGTVLSPELMYERYLRPPVQSNSLVTHRQKRKATQSPEASQKRQKVEEKTLQEKDVFVVAKKAKSTPKTDHYAGLDKGNRKLLHQLRKGRSKEDAKEGEVEEKQYYNAEVTYIK